MTEPNFVDFFEAVRQKPFVYGQKHEHFRNKESKAAFWLEMAEKYNLADGKAAEKKWNYFRDNFKKNKKAMNLPSGSGSADVKPKWPYYNSLTFLEPHLLERDGASSSMSQVLFKGDETAESDGDLTPADENADPSIWATPIGKVHKRKSGSSTPLEKKFLASIAMQEKVLESLTEPETAEDEFGRHVGKTLSKIAAANAGGAEWAKLKIQEILYNAQYPPPPPPASHGIEPINY